MNTTRRRVVKMVSVIALVLGTLSLCYATIAQWLLAPAAADTAPAETAAAQPDAFALLALISVLGPMLLLVGIPAVGGLARERGWGLTLLGTYITGLGLAAGVGHLALFFGLYGDLAIGGADSDAVQAIGRAEGANPLSAVLLIIFLLGFSLGPILLALGLRRAGLVAVWVPVALVVAAVASFAGGVAAGIIQLVAFTGALAAFVVAVWRGPRTAANGLPDGPLATVAES